MQIDHEYFMRAALKEAEEAYSRDEVPIGAVIVKDEKIIASGHNQTVKTVNSLAHAEMIVLSDAMKKLSVSRLNGCSLYVTLEPCIMCAGAILHARIDRVFFGLKEPKFGGVVSINDIFDNRASNHRVEWLSGILEDEIKELMSSFFKKLR